MASAEDHIKVAARLRPLNDREKAAGNSVLWNQKEDSIVQIDPLAKRRKAAALPQFHFDSVFGMAAGNRYVYDGVVAPIVESAMRGFNGTTFAYGQTGSGKTHTILGTEEDPGIIRLTIEDIFDKIESSDRNYYMRASYFEIYKEKVNDLLSGLKDVEIHENGKKEVVVPDLKKEPVTSIQDVLTLLDVGEPRRHYGETNVNEHSSRSHTIFRLIIESESREPSDDSAVEVSELNVVDLAGSERADEAGTTGDRTKESRSINQSLSELGRVIKELSEGSTFVNCRTSKLTRILQNSLGGNAKTCIICTVTPTDLDRTSRTLQFASQAKKICNKPQKNEVMTDDAMLKQKQKEIAKLRQQVSELAEQNGLESLQLDKLEMERVLAEKEEKIAALQRLIICSSKLNCTPVAQKQKVKSRRDTWCPGQHLRVASFHLIRSPAITPSLAPANRIAEAETASLVRRDDNRQQLDALRSQLREREELLLKACDEKALLQNRLDEALEGEKQSRMKAEQAEKQCRDLAKEVQALTAAKQESEHGRKHAESQRDKTSASFAKLQKDHASMSEENAKLRKAAEGATVEHEGYVADMRQKYTQQVEELREQVENLTTSKTALDDQKQLLEAENGYLKEMVKTLTSAKQDSERGCEKAETERDKISAFYQKLQNDQATITFANDELQAAFDDVSKQLDVSERKLALSIERVATLEQEVKTVTSSKQDSVRLLQEADANLAKVSSDYEELRKAYDEKSEAEAGMRKDYEALKDELENLKQSNADMETQLRENGNFDLTNEALPATDSRDIESGDEPLAARFGIAPNKQRCTHCHEQFASRRNVSRHVTTAHQKSKLFGCEHCPKRFDRKDVLQQHVTGVHQKQRQFACRECGRTFASKSHLVRHAAVHLKPQSYACEHCKRLFSLKTYLDGHLAVKHGIGHPAVCCQCNKAFGRKQHLKLHIDMKHRKI